MMRIVEGKVQTDKPIVKVVKPKKKKIVKKKTAIKKTVKKKTVKKK